MQLPSTLFSKWRHKIKSIRKQRTLDVAFSRSYQFKNSVIMQDGKRWKDREVATIRMILSFSMEGCEEVCSAQVSDEQLSCCQLPALGFILGKP